MAKFNRKKYMKKYTKKYYKTIKGIKAHRKSRKNWRKHISQSEILFI